MNFYNVLVTYESTSIPFVNEDRKLTYDSSAPGEKEACYRRVAALNEELGIKCTSNKSTSIFVHCVTNNTLCVAFAIDLEHGSLQGAKKYLSEYIYKNFDVVNIKYSEQNEFAVEDFCKLLYGGTRKDLLKPAHEIIEELGLDYFGNNQYKIKEEMLEDKKISLKEARRKAAKILADKSLMDEIERIYSEDNTKKYYGNPVHYEVIASNKAAADDIINVLTLSLKSNKRLLGKRISRISEITNLCYDEEDVENIFSNARGGAVVIDMSGSEEDHGNYASSYHEVIDYFTAQAEKYQLNTLFIFVELTNHPGFSKPLLSKMQENMDIVELREGSASRNVVKDFIKEECKRRGLKTQDEDVEQSLSEGDMFTVGEAYVAVNTLYKDSLKNTW